MLEDGRMACRTFTKLHANESTMTTLNAVFPLIVLQISSITPRVCLPSLCSAGNLIFCLWAAIAPDTEPNRNHPGQGQRLHHQKQKDS